MCIYVKLRSVSFTQKFVLYAIFQLSNIELRALMNKIIYLALVTTFITGCGAEIAYKQGATARDLQANKAICQKAVTEVALNQCLESNGWAVQKLGEQWLSDDDLFATASVSESNQNTTKPKKAEGLKTTDSIKIEDAPIKAQTSSVVNLKEAVVKENVVTETKVDEIKLEMVKPEVTVKPAADILKTYEIKSWWKMGGGAALLEQNMNECSTALGAAHHPDKKTFTFTRGFAICMREKGWRGLITQNK